MSSPTPPSWKDLGKLSSDLLNKDYPKPGQSLEVNTKAPNGVSFKIAGHQNPKTEAVTADLEIKNVDPKLGATTTFNWSQANVLKGSIELDGQLAKGLKFEAHTSVAPESSIYHALFNTQYKTSGVHARGFFNFCKGPVFTGDVVVGQQGFLLGGEASYDVNEAQIKHYNFATGYSNPDYNVTVHALANLSKFSASYYHRVNADVEAGAQAIYSSKSSTNAVSIEVGAKTYLDNAAFIKAKMNSAGVLGLGYTQALRPGVTMSLGIMVDTKNLGKASEPSKPAHNMGISLTFKS